MSICSLSLVRPSVSNGAVFHDAISAVRQAAMSIFTPAVGAVDTQGSYQIHVCGLNVCVAII